MNTKFLFQAHKAGFTKDDLHDNETLKKLHRFAKNIVIKTIDIANEHHSAWVITHKSFEDFIFDEIGILHAEEN